MLFLLLLFPNFQRPSVYSNPAGLFVVFNRGAKVAIPPIPSKSISTLFLLFSSPKPLRTSPLFLQTGCKDIQFNCTSKFYSNLFSFFLQF